MVDKCAREWNECALKNESIAESNRETLSMIVCVKLGDDIHNPGEMTGQFMALK